MSPAPQANATVAALRTRWAALDARERRLVSLAAAVVGLALLWWLALGPPLRTLREAGAQRATLQVEAERMQALKAEAERLKAQPKVSRDDALRALEAAVKQRLGAAGTLAVAGDRATVTLKAAPAAALAAWLQDARVNARAVPVEARLTRAAGSAASASASWDGSVSLSIGGAP